MFGTVSEYEIEEILDEILEWWDCQHVQDIEERDEHYDREHLTPRFVKLAQNIEKRRYPL